MKTTTKSSRFFFTVAVVIILSVVIAATTAPSKINALRIGIFTVEESGHLLPMTAIAHEAVKQGHKLDVFLPRHAIANTRSLFPTSKENPVNFVPVIGAANQLVGDHEDNFTLYQQVTESDTLTSLTIVNERSHIFFKEMIPGLRKTIEDTYCGVGDKVDDDSSVVDVLLTDYAMNNLMLAIHRTIPCIRKKPLVYLWPLTLSLPTTTRSYIPALSSGLTIAEIAANPLKRFGNYLLQRLLILGQRMDSTSKLQDLMIVSELSKSPSSSLEQVTKKVDQQLAEEIKTGDFDVINEILVNHFVITPSIYGLDLAQPLCPNIRPVGFLNPPPAKDGEDESKKINNNKNNNNEQELAKQDGEDMSLPSEWKDWLDNDCLSHPKGAIYVNMGSVAILPVEWLQGMEKILRHFSEKEGLCVVWKMRLREQRRLLQPPAHLASLNSIKKEIASGAFDTASPSEQKQKQQQQQQSDSEKEAKKFLTQPQRGNKLAIVARIPFAPKLLLSAKRKINKNNNQLQNNYVAAFVSHCGDTSVYESVEALVPIVGIPLFADQPDMCARIVDAGVGVSIDKRSLALPTSSQNKNNNHNNFVLSSPLYSAIQNVINDRSADEESRKSSMVSKMSYLKRVGESMGGAAEAVRIIELSAMHRGETIKHFTCSVLTTKLPWYLRDNWDICIQLGLLVLPVLWLVKKILGLFIWIIFRLKKKNNKQEYVSEKKKKE